MSEDLEPQEVSLKNIQKRRIRSDTQNRDFKCQCGKGYLSYPALYTHIKQKHPENIQQLKKNGGINKPQTAQLPRGRPKVIKELNEKEQENIQYAALSVTELLIIQLVEIFKGMDEFKNKPIILIDNNNLSLAQVRKQLQPFGLDLEYLLKQKLVLPVKPSSMRELTIYFLFLLQKHFSAYVFAHLALFFHIFLQVYEATYMINPNKIQIQFFNEFIDDLYKKQKDMLQIRIWEQNPKILHKVLGAFGNWMHVYGYINHKVEIIS